MNDYDEAINSIADETQREAASGIVRRFSEAGLPVKVKRLSHSKPCDRFRILCYVQKNKESVVVNTDMWGFGGLRIQMRIFNGESFERLNELSENIRSQIVNGRDCSHCWPKCDGKQYRFSYGGTEYVKCQNFGCNFRFKIADEADADNLTALTEREIGLAKRESN